MILQVPGPAAKGHNFDDLQQLLPQTVSGKTHVAVHRLLPGQLWTGGASENHQDVLISCLHCELRPRVHTPPCEVSPWAALSQLQSFQTGLSTGLWGDPPLVGWGNRGLELAFI